jgi:hypothetical protein
MKGSRLWIAAGYFLKATLRMAPPESVKFTSTKLFTSLVTVAPERSAWAVVNVGSSAFARPAGRGAAAAGACVTASWRTSAGAGRGLAYFWL